METTTDPEVNVWFDTFGYENGDKCAYDYGVLGLDGGLANEEWNGHFYVVQQEWSNLRNGCAQDAVSHAVANDDLAGAVGDLRRVRHVLRQQRVGHQGAG